MGMERKRNAIKEVIMKEIIKHWKAQDFNYVYENLKKRDYDYTSLNIARDFKKVKSMDRYAYCIYLLSRELTAKNVVLLNNMLTFTDTCFIDVHSVIEFYSRLAIEKCESNESVMEWIVSYYKGHPSSPFDEEEIEDFEKLLEERVVNNDSLDWRGE